MNLKFIPSGLITLRFLIVPYLLWDALDGETSVWFLVVFIFAFLSDIFDGIIARRLGVSTPQLRQANSWADVCLYLCIAASTYLVHPQTLIIYRLPLLIVIIVQIIWWIVNLIKYGKPASYHTYSAKLWEITLFIATIALFGFNYAQITLWLTCIIGTLHTMEEIAMTLILLEWENDVLSIFHALKLRH